MVRGNELSIFDYDRSARLADHPDRWLGSGFVII